MWRSFFIAVGLALAGGALLGILHRPSASKLLGGKGIARLIASPQGVKAWRTVGSRRNTDEFTGSDAADLWRKDGDPTSVPPELAAELGRILARSRSYQNYFHLGQAKSSVPQPCVVLNFSDGMSSVDLFLSFADNSLFVISPTNANPADPGSALANADFDPSRAELVRVVKKVFPKDARIQSLNETKANGFLWPRDSDKR